MLKNKLRKKTKNKKAQITVVDFGLSIFIFTILVTVIVISLYNYHDRVAGRLEDEMIVASAVAVTDNFVKTSGYPNDWTIDDVKIIGLATRDRVLSQEKVDKFCQELEYDRARQIMGLMYHFHFSLSVPEAEFEPVQCGSEPIDANRIVTIRRAVVYQDEPALLQFTLWR